jgi:hypothetical protein
MADRWLPGEYARIELQVKTAAGAAADPGALRLKVKSPTGALSEYVYGTAAEVVRDGLGAFHADILLDAPGYWYWRWETLAPNAGATEGGLVVQSSSVL